MGVDQQAHRAGALKQKNKTHKTGRHRSKGAIDNELKGAYFCKQNISQISFFPMCIYIWFRFVVFSGKTSIKVLLRKQKNAMTKEQRRHQALQVLPFA